MLLQVSALLLSMLRAGPRSGTAEVLNAYGIQASSNAAAAVCKREHSYARWVVHSALADWVCVLLFLLLLPCKEHLDCTLKLVLRAVFKGCCHQLALTKSSAITGGFTTHHEATMAATG
jgi:hypothetical protein